MNAQNLATVDPRLAAHIVSESDRIEDTIDLIAAENHPPAAVLETLGSVFSLKTIEGYPGGRFHGGCRWADEVERLAVSRCCRLFGASHANVQPLSGTTANLAVYFALLSPGDRVLAMGLPFGGHLSHGHPASITSQCFDFTHYGLDPDTERIDYGRVEALARELRPRMIVAGASSYPRLIRYEAMADIARAVGAYLMVDMAHLAGLVAAGVIPSPVPHADAVTFTGYKTLMGCRGGVILCRDDLAARIDKAVFPGCQGTSPVNIIAAKALTFKMAGTPRFRRIQQQTVDNAAAMAAALARLGHRIVSGGTDNHQVLIDLSGTPLSGREAETALESSGIVLNRNVVPADAGAPGRVSGLRIGTAAAAARGMGSEEMQQIAGWIHTVLSAADAGTTASAKVRQAVADLCRRFPVYRHV